jgi:cell division protein FtsB
MLVKMVQEQQKEIQKLKEENEIIKKEILKFKRN